MPRFKVLATMYTDLEVVVEAKNPDEAFQIANELDWADFGQCPNDGDWKIEYVIELDEKGN